MRQYRFLTCDVFTDTAFGGNPLAVVPEAEGLTDARMQAIAAEFNLSETIFVFRPLDAAHTARVRIFTPRAELPFAGHPTVGCALMLAALGRVERSAHGEGALVLEENVGPVAVRLAPDESGRPTATFTAPQVPRLTVEGLPPAPVLARLLSLEAGDAVTREPLSPAICSAGVPFLVVPVSPETLDRIRFDTAVWAEHLKDGPAPHVYVVAPDDPQRPAEVRARMFAPALGIAEDPATGSAATALAVWLDRLRPAAGDDSIAWTIRQGVAMGRPSTIEVSADRRDGALKAVHVGGTAVMISDGTMAVPD